MAKTTTTQTEPPQIRSFLSPRADVLAPPMFDEITSQARGAWQDALEETLPSQIAEIASQDWFRAAPSITLIGVGSSENVLRIGAYPAPKKGPIYIESSTSYCPRGESPLLVVVTQSGETADTLQAARAARQHNPALRVIGVTAAQGSTLQTQIADETIVLKTPPEKAIAATVTLSVSTMAVRSLLCAWDGLPLDYDPRLPSRLQRLIEDQCRPNSVLARLVSALAGTHYLAVLADGGGAYYGVARESALKIRETAGMIAEAANPREFRHGPVESLASPVLAEAGVKRAAILLEPGLAVEGVVEFYEELASRYRGTDREFTFLSVSAGDPKSQHSLVVPEVGEPLLAVVLWAQMLAYELALRAGLVPGTSDVLSKVVAGTQAVR